MAIIQDILLAKTASRKLLVVLVDPDKPVAVEALCPYLFLSGAVQAINARLVSLP